MTSSFLPGSCVARLLRAAFGLALGVSAAAQAANHIVDLKWQDGTFSHETTIAAGKFFEVCGALPRGARVDWQFAAAAPMDFNIHYHLASETVYLVKQAAVSTLQSRFEAPRPETYCWMWTNLSASSVKLTVRLQQVR
jgi:hypothetical protein